MWYRMHFIQCHFIILETGWHSRFTFVINRCNNSQKYQPNRNGTCRQVHFHNYPSQGCIEFSFFCLKGIKKNIMQLKSCPRIYLCRELFEKKKKIVLVHISQRMRVSAAGWITFGVGKVISKYRAPSVTKLNTLSPFSPNCFACWQYIRRLILRDFRIHCVLHNWKQKFTVVTTFAITDLVTLLVDTYESSVNWNKYLLNITDNCSCCQIIYCWHACHAEVNFRLQLYRPGCCQIRQFLLWHLLYNGLRILRLHICKQKFIGVCWL